MMFVSTKLKEGGGDCRLEQPGFCLDKVKSKGFRRLPLAGRSVFDVCFIETGAFVDLSSGADRRTHHVLHSLSTSISPYSLTHLRLDLKKRGDNKGKYM
eukprot:8276698-Ditylum_brightwellii.AAC.1